jgi:hypothetical protein
VRRLLPSLAIAVAVPLTLTVGPGAPAVARRADVPSPLTAADAAGDVHPGKLDIRDVTVTNTPTKVVVRVAFPGVAKTFDYPTGAVSVFLDTDPTRKGAEFGHFMDFWSDYRFAKVSHWREHPTRAWGHDPEGRCVGDAAVIGDKGHHLRWFRYVVRKREGCFGAPAAVRVAVETINTGDLDPYVAYDRPVFDDLGARHQWTDWVTVG